LRERERGARVCEEPCEVACEEPCEVRLVVVVIAGDCG